MIVEIIEKFTIFNRIFIFVFVLLNSLTMETLSFILNMKIDSCFISWYLNSGVEPVHQMRRYEIG